ncbi:glutathione S-transferase U18-like [Cornus florida]|uniref:glutathione S-transferase U18-like n=1 Tax=Cornus florida TaxID=4283 RepID=UPI0028990FC3|nr:glutathione S-transferase U18-like [Cornus florida]
MASSDLKLLGTLQCPYVCRARVALNLKSVNYELLVENLGSKSELLLQSNPVQKKVPVLIHGDKIICESLIIVRYIDQVWTSGPSILPSDAYDHAIACFWAAYIDQKLVPPLMVIGMTQEEEKRATAIEEVVAALAVLEETFVKCSKGKPFFGGDSIGYLDIAFGSFLVWLKVAAEVGGKQLLDETKTPCLVAWAERFCSDDTVKDIIPDIEKLIEQTRAKLASTNSN